MFSNGVVERKKTRVSVCDAPTFIGANVWKVFCRYVTTSLTQCKNKRDEKTAFWIPILEEIHEEIYMIVYLRDYKILFVWTYL